MKWAKEGTGLIERVILLLREQVHSLKGLQDLAHLTSGDLQSDRIFWSPGLPLPDLAGLFT